MKKVKFIYNPFSGERKILKYLDYIISTYQKNGYIIIPFRISAKVNLEDAFCDVDNSYDHILVSGGDGTVNQIVNIIKNKNLDIPLAVLPAGTANDFAHVIGMPDNIKESINLILKSLPKFIDLGKVNDKYFINIFSCGLFTDVSQKTPTEQKNTFGKLAYYYTGLKSLPTFKKLNLSVKSDNFSFNGTSIVFFVFNGRTAGGINLSPNSLIDDGMLDVIIVDGENILEKISFLYQFFLRKNLTYPKGIIHFQSNKLEIEIDENYITDIDGEPGPQSSLLISCEKNSLKILGFKKDF